MNNLQLNGAQLMEKAQADINVYRCVGVSACHQVGVAVICWWVGGVGGK